jgi:hypothetical protein
MGAGFEVAVVVGLPLFEAEPDRLVTLADQTAEKLALLPKSARKSKRTIKDDF